MPPDTSHVTLAERVLLALSEPVGSGLPEHSDGRWDAHADTLITLKRAFPDLPQLIREKDVCDFGCGSGYQSVALALAGAHSVYGLDIQPHLLETGKTLSVEQGVGDKVSFGSTVEPQHQNHFDVVISLDAMEHMSNVKQVLEIMGSVLKPGGLALISFGPPFYAPYGAHMHFFTKVPWVHLLFPERTVMAVRSRFRDDGAMRYEDVPGGLGKLSVRKFKRILAEVPSLRVQEMRCDAVKKLGWLAAVPFVQELFINNVAVVLVKAS